jgi:MFS family permease
MAIGYPLGAVIGGTIAAQLLKGNDWRAVFYFGSAITAAFIPLVYLFVPESVHWLTQKQPKGALDKINLTLKRMHHSVVTVLPQLSADASKRRVVGIFGPGLVATTIVVTAAYFLHITTFYFILKWVPKIVVDMGFAASSAAGVLVWTNVGGALGGALFGLLTLRVGVKPLTITVLILSTVMVTIFGRSPPELQHLSLVCAIAGFFTNAGIVGLYAILAQAFPTHVRASGTGFAIGVGRGGSVLAPIAAGFLFQGGYGLPVVALTMAFGSLVAAGILMFLKLKPEDAVPASSEGRTELKSASATV